MQCAVLAGCPVDQVLTLRLNAHGRANLRDGGTIRTDISGPAGRFTWTDWTLVDPSSDVSLVTRTIATTVFRKGQSGLYKGSGIYTSQGVNHVIHPFLFSVGEYSV